MAVNLVVIQITIDSIVDMDTIDMFHTGSTRVLRVVFNLILIDHILAKILLYNRYKSVTDTLVSIRFILAEYQHTGTCIYRYVLERGRARECL